jgi:hypothetical protein
MLSLCSILSVRTYEEARDMCEIQRLESRAGDAV